MERIKIKLPEHFNFSAKIPIRITDLNYAGHVGNDTFLALVHEARQQFLLHHGYTELQFEGCGLIMTDAAIEFKKELNYGEIIKIAVAATGFDKYGFDIFYKLDIVKGDGLVLAGKAKTGMLCYDYANKKLVPVPEKARQKLNGGV
jgi:acyl-CoA thioesterase FadM